MNCFILRAFLLWALVNSGNCQSLRLDFSGVGSTLGSMKMAFANEKERSSELSATVSNLFTKFASLRERVLYNCDLGETFIPEIPELQYMNHNFTSTAILISRASNCNINLNDLTQEESEELLSATLGYVYIFRKEKIYYFDIQRYERYPAVAFSEVLSINETLNKVREKFLEIRKTISQKCEGTSGDDLVLERLSNLMSLTKYIENCYEQTDYKNNNLSQDDRVNQFLNFDKNLADIGQQITDVCLGSSNYDYSGFTGTLTKIQKAIDAVSTIGNNCLCFDEDKKNCLDILNYT